VASSCAYCIEPLGATECGEFVDSLVGFQTHALLHRLRRAVVTSSIHCNVEHCWTHGTPEDDSEVGCDVMPLPLFPASNMYVKLCRCVSCQQYVCETVQVCFQPAICM
jgi:hypothetical protein